MELPLGVQCTDKDPQNRLESKERQGLPDVMIISFMASLRSLDYSRHERDVGMAFSVKGSIILPFSHLSPSQSTNDDLLYPVLSPLFWYIGAYRDWQMTKVHLSSFESRLSAVDVVGGLKDVCRALPRGVLKIRVGWGLSNHNFVSSPSPITTTSSFRQALKLTVDAITRRRSSSSFCCHVFW